MPRQRVCVFCGSSRGSLPAYERAARELADVFCKHDVGLVYGGAQRGLMGVIADRMLELGGEVIGVIPSTLVERDVAHRGLTRLHVVETMHERKALMAANADAFLALPGGFGTLEELMEVVTWAQLGLHDKPIGMLNTEGYFDTFLAFIRHMTEQGFVSMPNAEALRIAHLPEQALAMLLARR
jgi:uncharacterized protein (TIGR00730 family)